MPGVRPSSWSSDHGAAAPSAGCFSARPAEHWCTTRPARWRSFADCPNCRNCRDFRTRGPLDPGLWTLSGSERRAHRWSTRTIKQDEVRTMLIRELMTAPAVTVTDETSIAAALQLLDVEKITAMPVVDRRGALVGLVSEADLVGDADLIQDRVPISAVRTSGLTPARRVAEVMTHLVVSVDPEDDLEVAVDLMRATMMKSLPVIQHRKVVGMLSRSDIIHLLAGRDQRIRDDAAE